jgi:SAM-dependent methyltransferase
MADEPRSPLSADIFAGQGADPELLAELYDLEHDAVTADFAFYREMVSRLDGPVLDLGCGSGRLFRSFLDGGASRIVGIDGSPALLRRAEARIAADPVLAAAAAASAVSLLLADVRALPRLPLREGIGLAVAAGVLPHLDGPDEALRLLAAIEPNLAPDGRLVIDDVGPGLLPVRDLPLSVDWRRKLHGRDVVRRSSLIRRKAPEGLRIAYSTITDTVRPDGTIARLPASHRLWYPYPEALERLVAQAGMRVEMSYGSHDLEPPGPDSERRIVVVARAR